MVGSLTSLLIADGLARPKGSRSWHGLAVIWRWGHLQWIALDDTISRRLLYGWAFAINYVEIDDYDKFGVCIEIRHG